MAVLARATITLAQTVDIASVTWYYKLQASTASAPAKPTAETPSGWTTTEPTYTEGSTNSLYVVQKTTFSDGSFEYSDVSLSSSYEAAKTAYNKSVQAKQAADAAQEDIDNLEVGGRNLILNTLRPDATGSHLKRPHLIGQTTNTTGRGTCTVAEHGIRFTTTSENWAYIYFGASGNTATPSMLGLEAGETYTLSADLSWKILSSEAGMADEATRYMGAMLWYSKVESGSFQGLGAINNFPIEQADKGTEMSARLEYTFKVPLTAKRLYLGIRSGDVNASHYAIGDYIEARNLKLERGNRATDWTPAPEDLENAIEGAEQVATNYVTDITGGGVFVHPEGEGPDDTETPTGWKIADALELIKAGVAHFKVWIEDSITKVRVGRSDQGHTDIDSNGMRIFGGDGTLLLANIGYGEGNAEVGTEVEPYYSFGDRVGIPGNYSVAEGSGPEASGVASHAEGDQCSATAQGAHSEGVQTEASAVAAHSEGETCTASGRASHAEGSGTSATRMGDHSEGVSTTASGGHGAHAEGYDNTASGAYSHAGGVGNTAAYEAQTVIGKYASAPASDDLLIIGNGSSASNRSNAMRLKSSGRVEFAGAVGTGLSWTTRTEMVNAMTGLSLGRPYCFYAAGTWTNTAGAGSSDAFGVICKTTTTQWQMILMTGGNVYKSIFTWNGTTSGTFNTTQVG